MVSGALQAPPEQRLKTCDTQTHSACVSCAHRSIQCMDGDFDVAKPEVGGMRVARPTFTTPFSRLPFQSGSQMAAGWCLQLDAVHSTERGGWQGYGERGGTLQDGPGTARGHRQGEMLSLPLCLSGSTCTLIELATDGQPNSLLMLAVCLLHSPYAPGTHTRHWSTF